MWHRRHAPTLAAAVIACLWGLGLALAHWEGHLSGLERMEAPLADLRFLIQGPRTPPSTITIIAIDDRTVREAGSYPLSRATMARLVSKLARMKPKVIALDILFVDSGPPDADLALASALREAPTVLAAAGLFERDARRGQTPDQGALDEIPAAQSLLLPIEALASTSAIGVVNIATDPSGVPRSIPLLLRANSRLLPSFPLRTASVAAGSNPAIAPDGVTLGDVSTRTDEGFNLPLRFYGPSGTIRTISASEVLNDQVDESTIRHNIIIVGATVAGGGDSFPTPFDPLLPGVEVLATATAHLIEGDGLVRDRRTRLADGVMAVTLPVLLVLLLAWHRSLWGFAMIAVAAAAWIAVTVIGFTHGLWLSASLPLVAAMPPAVLFGAAQLWLDRIRAERLRQQSRTLRNFQPPSLARRLAKDPAFLSTPVRQEAAVVFVDLSGFTGLSEILALDDTREMLRQFHTLVDREAVQREGVVASFMGDGAMILFGLPDPGSMDACHAVEFCVHLCSRMEEWIATLPDPIASRIGFKIGAHHGVIIASRLGGDSHQHITAIGDTVNVASRLMEVAAFHEADVALSDDLYQAAGSACSIFGNGVLDGVVATSIRGRANPISIWLWRRKPVLEKRRAP